MGASKDYTIAALLLITLYLRAYTIFCTFPAGVSIFSLPGMCEGSIFLSFENGIVMENGEGTTEETFTPDFIRDLIAQEKIKQAFASSRQLAKQKGCKDILNNVTSQSGKFKKNEEDLRSGAINLGIYNTERSKIIQSLLHYVTELEEYTEINAGISSQSNRKKESSGLNALKGGSSNNEPDNSQKDSPYDLKFYGLVVGIISGIVGVASTIYNFIFHAWSPEKAIFSSVLLLLVLITLAKLWVPNNIKERYLKWGFLVIMSTCFLVSSASLAPSQTPKKIKILIELEIELNKLNSNTSNPKLKSKIMSTYFTESSIIYYDEGGSDPVTTYLLLLSERSDNCPIEILDYTLEKDVPNKFSSITIKCK